MRIALSSWRMTDTAKGTTTCPRNHQWSRSDFFAPFLSRSPACGNAPRHNASYAIFCPRHLPPRQAGPREEFISLKDECVMVIKNNERKRGTDKLAIQPANCETAFAISARSFLFLGSLSVVPSPSSSPSLSRFFNGSARAIRSRSIVQQSCISRDLSTGRETSTVTKL